MTKHSLETNKTYWEFLHVKFVMYDLVSLISHDMDKPQQPQDSQFTRYKIV